MNSYDLGAITALVQKIESKPDTWVSLVYTNPLEKLSFDLRNAIKRENHVLHKLLVDLFTQDLPSKLIDTNGQFFIGYYQTKSKITKLI